MGWGSILMAIARFASGKPAAKTNSMLYSVEKSSLISVVAVNLSGATKITAWVVPNNETDPAKWIYFANEIELTNRNTFETFKTAVNVDDEVYVRSESGNVSFFINGLYETSGTSDIFVGTRESVINPQVGTIVIDNNEDPAKTYYWDGSVWKDAGTEGPPGPVNSLSIGPVTAVGPEGSPSATITGTSPNQVLNLTLQQGPEGPPGSYIVSETVPTLPIEGNVWFNTTNGRFFVYYDNYWVETSSNEAGPVGETGPVWQPYWINVSSNYQSVIEDGLFLDSRNGSFTVFLNPNPNVGDAITLVDAGSYLNVNSVSIDGSGNKILGKSGILILNVKDAAVMLIYVNEEIGWKVT
jgi:hypothetical protein